jgi:dolichyl-phosphate beta-glucosyltransferase
MSESVPAPFLSVVVPAYNEAGRLPATLDALAVYLARQPYTAEVIVVDDGSTDATADVVRTRARTWPALRLLTATHRGKGHAVKLGLLATTGDYAFLCDADLSMPIEELARFVSEPADSVEVAIASREGPGAHRYGEPLYRHLMGRAFNIFVRWAVLPGVQDSQCGFKCLRGDLARRIATVQTIEGWGFDVELLCVARRWGYRIVEIPIAWHFAPSSRIRPLRDAWRMAREVWMIRRHARRGLYATAPAVLAGAEGGERSSVRTRH